MKLVVESIGKRLDGRTVLSAVSFALEASPTIDPKLGGSTIALLGENGAGKSTLLRIIAGVLEPDAGSVTLDGESIARPSARRKIGYVPESADPLPHLSIGELCQLLASLRRASAPPSALVERLGLTALLGQRIGSLSLGQRRRACLLAALVGDPPLLLLDEPTNGLDPEGIAMFAKLLVERAEAGNAAIVATHELHFAQAIEGSVLRLASGKLV